MEKKTLREEIAKINYECFVGLSWEDTTEDERQGAYGHADKILGVILKHMFDQMELYHAEN
jgi:hypothetical protein